MTGAAPMSRWIYTLAWYVATPFVALYLAWRSLRQPEYRRHWAERWGLVRRRASTRPLIWLHAVSVGETRAAQPLVDALVARYPDAEFLLTHMTPTGRETGAALYAVRHRDRLRQAYLPYDYPSAVRRFLAAWRPALGIVMETELWPNLVAGARDAGVPLALVNARLSERSAAKGRRWAALIRPALAGLAAVAAQADADARRLAALGRDDAVITGNLKFDVDAPAAMVALGRAWRARFGGRPIVLLASTRDGEERMLVDAWREAVARRTRDATTPARERSPLLVVVPRHPQRFDEVAGLLAASGLAWLRRRDLDAAGDSPAVRDARRDDADARADALLGDSMGEMFAWYAMADVALIGGTWLPFGGQNLIEACAVGTPVVIGPHTYNFAEAAEQARAAGAALPAADAGGAVQVALALLDDDAARARAAQAALDFARAHRGATARTIAVLEPLLARIGRAD